MAFDRKSMESIVDDMITWSRGVSVKITDFSVGSKVRTIMEAIAIVLEERTDKLYRHMKELVETNIYSVFSFDKTPATYSTGIVTFSRSTTADKVYYIAAGTMLLSKASQYNAPVKFRTTVDAIIEKGATSVDVMVVCAVKGNFGNIAANTLTDFVQKPTGIDSVTNKSAFTTGAEEETADKQKIRFQEFMQAQSRGVLQSIAYGAKLAKLIDKTGAVTEAVLQAKATEDLNKKLGQVDLYIWNGVGTASSELIAAVKVVLIGSYDDSENPVYGYKPAGIIVNVYSAPITYVKIKLSIVPESWTTLDTIKPTVELEVARYFSDLVLGQTVIQSAVEANVKNISGVQDVKLYISTNNGTTYTMDNVPTSNIGVIAMSGSVVYV